MDGEDPGAVVASDDGVHHAAFEQPFPQADGAVVHRETPRQEESDTAAGARERECALHERLIQIDVATPARWIEARFAKEPHERRVPADDLPRRIADDGVEAGAGAGLAEVVMEDVGEFQRPVKEAVLRGEVGRRARPAIHAAAVQHAVVLQEGVQRRAQFVRRRRTVLRRPFLPEPSRAPQVAREPPRGKRRPIAGERGPRRFFAVNVRDGRFAIEAKAPEGRGDLAHGRLEIGSLEQR